MAILKKLESEDARMLRDQIRRAEEEAYRILENQGQHGEVNELDVKSVSVPALKLILARESGNADTEKLDVVSELSKGLKRIKDKMVRGFDKEAGKHILAIGFLALSNGISLKEALTNIERKRI